MRRSPQRRALSVIAAVEALREQHPEFAGPAKPRAVWRVLQREGIQVRRGRIRRKGRSSKFGGDAVITLRSDLPSRETWKYALHEYGHVRLHFPEHGEFEKHLSPCRAGDPREDEANLFALLLALGPTATPEHPDVARLIAKMEAAAHLARLPEQSRLELPEKPPAYRPPPPASVPPAGEWAEIRNMRRVARKMPLPITRRGRDDERIEWRNGVPIFTDLADRRWRITDYGPVIEKGRYVLGPVRAAARETAMYRKFANASGQRRVYTFRDARELRAIAVQHLDRQLAQSRRVRSGQSKSATSKAATSQPRRA